MSTIADSKEPAHVAQSQHNQFWRWVQWRIFTIGNVFERWFRFGKYASVDVQDCTDMDQINSGTGHEKKKTTRFMQFLTMLDSSIVSKLDFYLALLVVGSFLVIIRSAFALAVLWDRLLLVFGIGAIVIALMAFAVALFRKPNTAPVTPDQYKLYKQFLDYMSEDSRTPMPLWAMVVVFLMLLYDAALVSIVVIDFLGDLPRKYVLYGGIIMGVLVAIVLAFVDHLAGKQLYREHWRKDTKTKIFDEKNRSTDNTSITEEVIQGGKTKEERATNNQIGINNFNAEQRPFFRRYGALIFAIALLLLIGTLGSYARYNAQQSFISEQFSTALHAASIDVESAPVPPAIKQAQTTNQEQIVQEGKASAERAMIAALSILAVIFVAIQFVAMWFGYTYSFAYQESEKAYGLIRRHESDNYAKSTAEALLGASRQFVIDHARSYFGGYYPVLLKKANDGSKYELHKALLEREIFNFEQSVKNMLGNPKSKKTRTGN